MPTIKTKKEMNLGELLCWAIDNKEQASLKDFYSKNIGVKFNASGYPCIEFEKKFLPTYETFTVEIEEPITEDTELDLVERYISRYEKFESRYEHHQNKSINSALENNMPHIKTTHFYTEINDNLILIWRDGKLVE